MIDLERDWLIDDWRPLHIIYVILYGGTTHGSSVMFVLTCDLTWDFNLKKDDRT